MKWLFRAFAVLCVIGVLGVTPHGKEARAEDVTAKIYDDVKDVLIDLIRKEATKGVVRYLLHIDTAKTQQLECSALVGVNAPSNPREDAIAFYFHDAIDRLYKNQLASLGREFRVGLVALVSDAVLASLLEPPARTPPATPTPGATPTTPTTPTAPTASFELRAFVDGTKFKSLAGVAGNTRMEGYAWRLFVNLACGAEVPNPPALVSTTLLEERCHPVGDIAADDKVPCSVAQAVRSELTDAPSEMEFYVKQLLTQLYVQKLGPKVSAVFLDDEIKGNARLLPGVEAFFQALQADPTKYDEQVDSMLAKPLARGSLATGAGGRCTDELRAMALERVLGKAAAKESPPNLPQADACLGWFLSDRAQKSYQLELCGNTVYLGDLYGRLSSVDGPKVTAAIGRLFPPGVVASGDAGASEGGGGNAGCNARDAKIVVPATSNQGASSIALFKGADVDPAARRLLELFGEGDSLREAYEVSTWPPELVGLDIVQLLRVLQAGRQLLGVLKAIHMTVANTGGSDHVTGEPTSVLIYRAFTEACETKTEGVCGMVAKIKPLFGAEQFIDLVRYGVRGDMRALSTRVLDLVLPRETAEDPVVGERATKEAAAKPEATDKDKWVPTMCRANRCRKFLINFAAYVLDLVTNQLDDKSARAAFKAAAEELLVNDGAEGRTFRGGGRATGNWASTLIVPSASLRLSWNPDYYNGVGGDQFRTVVSIDWLTLLRWAPAEYFGVQVSLIDALAPFAEFAYRGRGPTSDSGYVLLDAIRPRLDFLLGVPSFSQRLVLSAGASLRTVSVTRIPGAAGTDPTLEYHFLTDCLGVGDAACRGYRFSGEFNLGVKLIF